MDKVTMTDEMVEFRCPADVRRLFGKAPVGGSGQVEFACRDCMKKKRTTGWRGMVVHVFAMDGAFVRTVTVTAAVRLR